MPIKPENKHLYPHNWKDIRVDILKRANNKCEFCRIENKAVGLRDKEGKFHTIDDLNEEGFNSDHYQDTSKALTIVLTIAHLDHNPQNNDYLNLKALCQKCHLAYDSKYHVRNARKTRLIKKGQTILKLEIIDV